MTEHLNENGILAFVLPTSFYNCSYYNLCREYIYKNISILHVENINVKYLDTQQQTMILILKKEKSILHRFIFERNKNIYISPNYKELIKLVNNTKTINELGFLVKTGSVVWNENKEKLTNDNTDSILIYSSNIIENQLKLNNLSGEKKQYIKYMNKTLEKNPCILVNRGYGNSFSFKYVLITEKIEFYCENHVNIIYSNKLNEKEAINILKIIDKSFKNEKTKKFLEYFVGNGSLSKTEIQNILPIFID